MKILITGGAGYVGSACLRYVASQGHEVMAYDNLAMGHRGAVDGHPLVEGDIADTDLLTKTLKDFGADAVMHFAAATYVGESVENPEYHYRNNVGGTLSLLCAMREAGVPTVPGSEGPLPTDPELDYDPQDSMRFFEIMIGIQASFGR